MATKLIFLLAHLEFFQLSKASADCNACPLGASSCPQTKSIGGGGYVSYTTSCTMSNYYPVLTGLQVAQEDGDGDDFSVTLMDTDGYNNFQAGHSYQYYSNIGTGAVGDGSTTCYQYTGQMVLSAGDTLHSVIKCTNRLETCHLRVKIDALCQNHATDPCHGVSCDSHGQCSNGACVCQDNYSGTNCQNYDPCTGVDCSSHGVCSTTLGTCVCDLGYTGSNCQNYDSCIGVYCSSNGQCSNGKCVCNGGYSGKSCSETAPCSNVDNYCLNGGTCSNGQCICMANYGGFDCSVDSASSVNRRTTIVILCSCSGGALLLVLLIFCCLAAYARSTRQQTQSMVFRMEAIPTPTNPNVTLVSAMEQQ